MKKRFPDFLVIGVQRAGSTWLYTQLKKHPDICMGKNRKEISYFDEYYNRDEKWYASFFKHCAEETIIGEVTPNYIYDKNCAERIYKLTPKAKLIIILRNPIDRAYSQYKKKVIDLGNAKSFMENLKNENLIAKKGLYYQQIKRYLKYFPRKQIKVLIFEEMIKKPEENLKKLSEFLGIKSNYTPDGYKNNVNPSEIPRFHKLYIFLRKMGNKLHKHDLSWMVKLWKRMKLNNFIFLKKRTKQSFGEIPKEAYDYLRSYYKEDVNKLSVFLGKDMNKFWGI